MTSKRHTAPPKGQHAGGVGSTAPMATAGLGGPSSPCAAWLATELVAVPG